MAPGYVTVMPPLEATVVITTRNRPKDLERAVASCFMQKGVLIRVLVFDDASDEPLDCTSPSMKRVELHRTEKRIGYIALRNEGFRLSTNEYVFSIDDDAYFTDPNTVFLAIKAFDTYPRTAAFALKYQEPFARDKEVVIKDLEDGALVRSYIGCSHVIKRSVALKLGGYREFFIHQGEERDLCLRIWNEGLEIRYLSTPSIIHEPSLVRDHRRWHYYGLRNTFLFSALNLPASDLLKRFAIDSVQLTLHFVPLIGIMRTAFWMFIAYGTCLNFWRFRKPVSRRVYSKYIGLPSVGPSFSNTRV